MLAARVRDMAESAGATGRNTIIDKRIIGSESTAIPPHAANTANAPFFDAHDDTPNVSVCRKGPHHAALKTAPI